MMIAGPKLELGDKTFVVPPANLKAIRAHSAALNAAETTQDRIDANVAFMLTTLQRNYPDLTEDFLLENIDTRNQAAVMKKIQEASGYTEVTDAGEPTPSAAQ